LNLQPISPSSSAVAVAAASNKNHGNTVRRGSFNDHHDQDSSSYYNNDSAVTTGYVVPGAATTKSGGTATTAASSSSKPTIVSTAKATTQNPHHPSATTSAGNNSSTTTTTTTTTQQKDFDSVVSSMQSGYHRQTKTNYNPTGDRYAGNYVNSEYRATNQGNPGAKRTGPKTKYQFGGGSYQNHGTFDKNYHESAGAKGSSHWNISHYSKSSKDAAGGSNNADLEWLANRETQKMQEKSTSKDSKLYSNSQIGTSINNNHINNTGAIATRDRLNSTASVKSVVSNHHNSAAKIQTPNRDGSNQAARIKSSSFADADMMTVASNNDTKSTPSVKGENMTNSSRKNDTSTTAAGGCCAPATSVARKGWTRSVSSAEKKNRSDSIASSTAGTTSGTAANIIATNSAITSDIASENSQNGSPALRSRDHQDPEFNIVPTEKLENKTKKVGIGSIPAGSSDIIVSSTISRDTTSENESVLTQSGKISLASTPNVGTTTGEADSPPWQSVNKKGGFNHNSGGKKKTTPGIAPSSSSSTTAAASAEKTIITQPSYLPDHNATYIPGGANVMSSKASEFARQKDAEKKSYHDILPVSDTTTTAAAAAAASGERPIPAWKQYAINKKEGSK